MKRIYAIVTGIFFLFVSANSDAQTKTAADYFAGKWNILIKGTPYGDLKRVYVLDKKDNGLAGVVQDTTGKEIAKFTKVELKEKEITLNYHSLGNDVVIVFTKKDDDYITGSMFGMFDATGNRIK
ncbi:MAG TPA: hypothetical protein PKC72_06075 [Chitinophagaceae bacterium]|nr:hypothetical protein [Chitinophagaceae bacterium]